MRARGGRAEVVARHHGRGAIAVLHLCQHAAAGGARRVRGHVGTKSSTGEGFLRIVVMILVLLFLRLSGSNADHRRRHKRSRHPSAGLGGAHPGVEDQHESLPGLARGFELAGRLFQLARISQKFRLLNKFHQQQQQRIAGSPVPEVAVAGMKAPDVPCYDRMVLEATCSNFGALVLDCCVKLLIFMLLFLFSVI